MSDTIAAMADAFTQLSSNAADVPLRIGLQASDGISLFMPAHLRDSHALGLKVVSVRAHNPARNLPSILALVALIDEETGAPLALMDGTTITAMRTAAGSGLATKYLARADAKIATIIGAGPQGRAHAQAMREVRAIEEVRITSAHFESAQKLVEELSSTMPVRAIATANEAVRGADIICCCTSSPTPVFDGHHLKAGAHINAIGAYTPTTRETDNETIRRANKIVVDSRATVPHEAGDLVIPIQAGIISEQDIYAELGELVLGEKAGRQSDDEVTLFKSVGNAAQDVAAAQAALKRAEALGIGTTIDLMA